MNLRNWLFNRVIPDFYLKKKMVRQNSGKGIALMYHEVLPESKGPAAWTVVKEPDFKEQILMLKQYFLIVTIEKAIFLVNSNEKTEKPYAIITFDDGYQGNLRYVRKIVEDVQIPITVFISTHAIETGEVYWYDRVIALLQIKGKVNINLSKFGLQSYFLNTSNSEKTNWWKMQQLLTDLKTLSPRLRENAVNDIVESTGNQPSRLKMMNKSEVTSLSSSPFVTIGGHSHCHNILTQLSDSELSNTIENNRNKLQSWTKQEIKHFSYPNGDFDQRVIAAVIKAGYKSAVTTQEGQWEGKMNHFQLPRYGVGRFDSLGLFIARIGQLV